MLFAIQKFLFMGSGQIKPSTGIRFFSFILSVIKEGYCFHTCANPSQMQSQQGLPLQY